MRPDLDLRAYLDTRGTAIMLPFFLVILVGFAALGGLLQPTFTPGSVSDVEMTVIALSLPLSLIIPVVAVLITAGEWSDRSIQLTLLQRPSRLGVLTSKILTAALVSLALIVLSIALAAAATWVGGELLGGGAEFSTLDDVLTVQLAVLLSYLLFALAMGVLTQSTVLGLIAAIGVPFVTATAAGIAAVAGSQVLVDVVRAVDLQSAAMLLGQGEAGAYELLPLGLLVVLPVALGAWRWRRREVG